MTDLTEVIEPAVIDDVFCTGLAKVQRLGPCLRLIFTVEDPSNWPDYKVLVANLIVPAEEAANIARGILAGPLPQPPKKTELHAVN